MRLDDEQLLKFYPKLDALHCPVDRSTQQRFGPISYAANTGMGLLPNDAVLGCPSIAVRATIRCDPVLRSDRPMAFSQTALK